MNARTLNALAPPHVRDAGADSGGIGVVCLHSNASSSSQWRALMERLAPHYRVFAPDSFGAGRSPAWPGGRRVALRDEVQWLEPVFGAAGTPHFLIGHSYGGAVALMAALAQPQRVRALVLYEPTLFSVLEQEAPGHPDTSGIRAAVADSAAAIEAHDPAAAGERFIDYWMGPGSWRRMPEPRRATIGASMVNVRGWSDALFGEPTPLHAFGALDVPVLYMLGARSPASSRGVARLLTQTLANVSVIEFADLGHMGPLTHAELVNDAIESFLSCH